MAKKKVSAASTEAVCEAKPTNMVDLDTLSYHDLLALSDKARKMAHEKTQEDRQKSVKVLASSDKMKAVVAKLKELNKEYKSLPKKFQTTLMVPIKFTLNVDREESLFEALRYVQCSEVEAEDIFSLDLDGELVYKDSNLDKTQKGYIEDAVAVFVEDACSESLNLFADGRKELAAFCEKISKVVSPVVGEMNAAGLHFNELK